MTYFRRKLWFADRDGHHEMDQSDLLLRREPVVVLGEPGMGKTDLLNDLASVAGNAFCRATQLINRTSPQSLLGSAERLVIDALDEVTAQSEGDAVDLVLRKLGELNYPQFILSCRAAEWRAALGARAIAEQYGGISPVEVHLVPLSEDEQRKMLFQLTGDEVRAKELIEHFESFGLGNPQTLKLIAALPTNQPLPKTSGELLEGAIETLRKEQNALKPELPRDDVLDAAGAAFAGLILTGNSRVVDMPSGLIAVEDGAIALSEIEAFDDGNVRRAANTNLFSTDNDGWTYAHRRIGEFVGARWLAKRADSAVKRRRLLELFQSHGLVPASLRGLHAWLARDRHLSDAVIIADPMGVVEYGDADSLHPNQARILFAALKQLGKNDPRFGGWDAYRAASLVTPALMDEVADVIDNPKEEFGFRLLLLRQLKGSESAVLVRDALRQRMLDESEPYGIRIASAEALATLPDEDWPALVDTLRLQCREDAWRLAQNLVLDVGLETFTNHQIVELITARDGLSISSVPRQPERNMIFGFYQLIDRIPVARLDALLDLLSETAEALLPEHAGIEENEFIDFHYGVLLRRLSEGDEVRPLDLWRWLRPFDEQSSYSRDNGDKVSQWLKANDAVRQAIQRYVLLEEAGEKDIWNRAWPLRRYAIDLYPSQADVLALLNALNPNDRSDLRWREVLTLGRMDGEEGQTLREAAKVFAQHRPDLVVWIDGLAERPVPKWERDREERALKEKARRAAKFAEHRRDYSTRIQDLRAGDYGSLVPPAQAYLKRFRDVGDQVPAHERVAEWLGEEIAEAAHEGFERFLQKKPPLPSAKAIAQSYAESKRWPAGDIIVAALAERVRTMERPFDGVTSERLAAGLFESWHSYAGDHAGLTDLEPRLKAELKQRGRWKQVLRIYIEPQLKRRLQHVDRLWEIMREDDGGIAVELAENWLRRFPEMSEQAETELVDRLLRSHRRNTLRSLIPKQLDLIESDERRRNWQAVDLLVNFDAAVATHAQSIEPDLLWHLRARIGGRWPDEGPEVYLSTNQIAWIISTFRKMWSHVSRPTSTSGDTNTWDASEYIRSLITRLGNDISSDAVAALTKLRDAQPDDYTWLLRTVGAEQHQKLADEEYLSPSLNQIASVLDGGPPANVADLRAIVIDELGSFQKRLRGSSEDEIDLFWTDAGAPRSENACRDRVISLLRGQLAPLSIFPVGEADMPQNKRADIVFQHDKLLLPIEAKRQQHPNIWSAIDDQLERFYTGHWQAEGQGIFLIFWFGPTYKLARRPDGGPKPKNAAEMRAAFKRHPAVLGGRVEVVVLDLSRE